MINPLHLTPPPLYPTVRFPAPPPSPHLSIHPLRPCSRDAAGRLQRGSHRRRGVCRAAAAACGHPLLPEQEKQDALWQEGQEGSVSIGKTAK